MIDITRIPALEEELRQARNVKPGGQEPDPGRIAAIEQEIAVHRAELSRQRGEEYAAPAAEVVEEEVVPEPEPVKRERPSKGSKETADAEAANETADVTEPEAPAAE